MFPSDRLTAEHVPEFLPFGGLVLQPGVFLVKLRRLSHGFCVQLPEPDDDRLEVPNWYENVSAIVVRWAKANLPASSRVVIYVSRPAHQAAFASVIFFLRIAESSVRVFAIAGNILGGLEGGENWRGGD